MDDLNQVLDEPFKVLCVDDSNLDHRIAPSELIERDTEYIVTNIYTDLISGEEAFVLLDKDPYPHKGFRVSRFKPEQNGYIPSLTSIN